MCELWNMQDDIEARRKVALYAGSFDPPSEGHLDIISRALTLYKR